MKPTTQKSQERGMALLVALFTLVLLSVIGLGLMYSTNMETMINSNYRDKQVAMYGAMSGLQEARDRLQPAAPTIPLPTDMPTLTNHQVFYIINPQDGETVAPWDSSSNNKYKDTELCQEGILGLTPTPGIPCDELPSGDEWYTVIDNSLDSSEPWKSAAPLDTKWIRITLKANNMTPVVASGDPGVTTETCWDGSHQILKPNGYGPDCGPDGSIVKVAVTSGGTGYTSPPTVTFSAPPTGGTLATGTAQIGPLATGKLSSITVNTPGAGYTTAPVVSIVGDGTLAATATAVIVPPGSSVTSVNLASQGEQCYAVPPTVSFSGGGSGATATATLEGTPSCVAGWTVTGSCSSKKGTTVTGVGLSGGDGSGFSGSITFKSGSGKVIGTSIENPGTGYTSNPTSLTDLTGCGSLTVTAIAGSKVDSLTLASGGTGYTSTPTVTVASGAGSGAAPTATATIGAATVGGTISAINLNNPGAGYTTPPLVVLTGGGLSVTTVATATASLAFTNTVTGITLDNPGLGYTFNPTVTLSGGGGTLAAATASRANGSDYGRVFLVTSMSQTKSGAKAMAQGEFASPVSGAWFPGALTLNGPNPTMDAMPNSMVFKVDGTDRDSCSEGPEDLRPAVGGYEDPDADPATHSVDDIVDAIPTGRLDHYIGTGGVPSVVNIYGSLGETMTSPTGLKALIDAVAAAPGAHVYGDDPGSIAMGSAANPAINYVDGDLTLAGSTDGYGVLVVTGKLIGSGAFQWHGIILVVGDGEMAYQGGGFPEINGTVFVSKIWDDHTTKNLLPKLGSPYMDWNGGGGNGIYYDHCWVENLIPIVPFTPPPSTKPLKTLSTRTVSY